MGMMSDDLDTKQIKAPDFFEVAAARAIGWAQQHLWLLGMLAGLLVAGLGGWQATVYYQKTANEKASQAFFQIEQMLQDTSISDAERSPKVKAALDAFIENHRADWLVAVAWLHLARIAAEANDAAAAQQAFLSAATAAPKGSTLHVVALVGLAKLAEDSDNLEQANTYYGELPQEGYQPLASYMEGRLALLQNQLEEARAQLKPVAQGGENIALNRMAGQVLYFIGRESALDQEQQNVESSIQPKPDK